MMSQCTSVSYVAFFVALLLLFPISAWSDAETEYGTLHARFLKLRNTDVQVEKRKEWIALADELVAYSLRNKKHERSAFAMYEAAILYVNLFDFYDDEEQLRFAEELLDDVTKSFPRHPLVIEALMKRGDIARVQRDEPEQAALFYERIIKQFPESELSLVAKSKLDKMGWGSESSSKTSTADKRKRLKSEQRALPQKGSPIIVLDPGHGGEDLGAVGVGGLREKDVVLAVSFQLKKILEEQLGATVRMTRKKDAFIPLLERTAMANDFGADLFVSLHANASPKGKVSGLEVYYLDNTGDQSSRKLAERENKYAGGREEGVGDLQFMLSDLIQNAKLEESVSLANFIEKKVREQLKPKWGIRSLGVKKAPFYVLVGAHMPCVLVEMFFIDHGSDAKNLALAKFRLDLAQGIANGISYYLQQDKIARATSP